MSAGIEIHKSSWLSSIIGKGKWYLVSSFLTKGIALILLPINTHYLSPEDYGILNSLTAIGRFLPVLISLYLDSAFSRYFHEYKNEPQKLKQLFSTAYIFVLIYGSIVLFLFLVSTHFWIEDMIKVPSFPFAYMAFIPMLLSQIGQFGLVFLRQSLETRLTTFVEVSAFIIQVSVSLVLLIIFKYGVFAPLWGTIVTSIVIFTFYTIYFIKKGFLALTFNKLMLKESLGYSIPLIPNIAGGIIMSMSDRLVIAKYVDLKAVGLYSIGFQLGYLLYMVQDAITQVTGAVSMSGLIYDKENTKRRIGELSIALWAFMLLANLFLVFFAREIITLFTESSFHEAYKIVPIIGFMYVLSTQYRLFSTIISYYKKTWVISIAGIGMGLINLFLNLILVPKYGYISSAWATIFSVLFYTVWIYFWSQKLDKINFNLKKICIVFFIYIVTVIAYQRFYSIKEITFILILSKTVVLIVFSYLSIKILPSLEKHIMNNMKGWIKK